MTRGIPQVCAKCGKPYIGSDAITIPPYCPNCNDGATEGIVEVSAEYLHDLEKIVDATEKLFIANPRLDDGGLHIVEKLQALGKLKPQYRTGIGSGHHSNTKPNLDQIEKRANG